MFGESFCLIVTTFRHPTQLNTSVLKNTNFQTEINSHMFIHELCNIKTSNFLIKINSI